MSNIRLKDKLDIERNLNDNDLIFVTKTDENTDNHSTFLRIKNQIISGITLQEVTTNNPVTTVKSTFNGGLILSSGLTLITGDLHIYTGLSGYTRSEVRTLVGETPPIGSVFFGTGAVESTKPNAYIKIFNNGSDTDWQRIVTQASD